MKKIYLSALMVSLAGISMAQQGSTKLQSKYDYDQYSNISTPRPVDNSGDRAVIVWEDDFSTPANWTMNNTSLPTSYNWVITTSQAAIPNAAPELQPFNSATAANGFALINSDGQAGNTDGNGAIIANIRTASPINCSASANVVLKFQHSYRWWQETRGVRVSGNNGATWTDFDITSLVGGSIANGYPNNQNSENPVYESINISAVAGGQSQVLVEFYYNDNDIWAWYWVVDDVKIIEQPLNDIQLVSASVSGTTNDGIEYGRTPLTQLDAAYNIGGEIFNFGVNAQTNLVLDADFTSFTSQSTAASLASNITVFIESPETPTLTVGMYTGNYVVESDLEVTGGSDFADNIYARKFEVTNNIYSLDGIGNHPVGYQQLDRIGTGSFTSGADNLVIAVQYRFKANEQVSGIRVMLHSTTVPGGLITASVKDTATFFNSDMASLFESAAITVTATHVTQGYVDIFFDQVEDLTTGVYFACVSLESLGNSSNIFIVDDQTVAQPSTASMIYIDSDASYTNGEAAGVRMLIGTSWGVGVEENTLTGISVYPNPSNGEFTITNSDNINSTVSVYNILGEVVYTSSLNNNLTTINLTSFGAGTYVVKVSNDNGTFVERVVIK